MSGKELTALYIDLFGKEPFVLTLIDIENETYKKMIGYCNIMGTPLTEEIVNKFFGNNSFDIVMPKNNNFRQFKK